MKVVPQKATAADLVQLGKFYANQKRFQCAANAFSDASKRDPVSAEIKYLWGLSLYSAEKSTEAIGVLRTAEDLAPSDVNTHLVLGAALEGLNRRDEAEREWRTALTIEPTATTALDRLSQDLIDRKDYAGVVALLQKEPNTNLRTSLQALNLGMALAALSRLQDAATVLQHAFEKTPDSLPIANELAIVLMLLSRPEEAYAVFDRALSIHPDDRPTQTLYLKILVLSHGDRAPQYAARMIAAYPNSWEVIYFKAVLETRDAEYTEARSHLERCLALNPNYAPAHNLLGSTLAKLGDLPASKKELETAITLGDSEPDVQYELARVLRMLGETESAKQKLKAYQEIKSAQFARSQAAGQAEMGDQAMASGDVQRAADLYRAALESDANEPLLYYKLAKALEKLSDTAGEKAALIRAIELKPDLAEAQNQIGYMEVRAGDLAEAERHFREAVKASPSYVIAWVNLAATLASEAKWQAAQQSATRALELDSKNAAAQRLTTAIANAKPAH